MGQPLVLVWAAHPAVTSTKQSAKYNWFFDNWSFDGNFDKCGCFSSSSSRNTLKRPACIHVACHRLPSCSSTRATSSQTWRLSSGNCTTCSPPRRMTNWKPSETNTPTSKSCTTKILSLATSRLMWMTAVLGVDRLDASFRVFFEVASLPPVSRDALEEALSSWAPSISQGEMLPCPCVYVL